MGRGTLVLHDEHAETIPVIDSWLRHLSLGMGIGMPLPNTEDAGF